MTADCSNSTLERHSRHADQSANAQLNLLSIMGGTSSSDRGTTSSATAEQHLPQVSLSSGSPEAGGSTAASVPGEQSALSTATTKGSQVATETSDQSLPASDKTQTEVQLLSLETQLLGLQVQILGDELNLAQSQPSPSGTIENSKTPALTGTTGEQSVGQPTSSGSVETSQSSKPGGSSGNEVSTTLVASDGATTQAATAGSTGDGATTQTATAGNTGDGATTQTATAGNTGDSATTQAATAGSTGDGATTQAATAGSTGDGTATTTAPTSGSTSSSGGTTTSTPGTVVADGGVVNPPASEGPVSPGTWQNESINGMNYEVLLPANYDPANKYPVVLYEHQLDMGTDLPDLENEVNPWFNTTEFRTDHPAIIVMPLLDQTADPSGETINFGGVSPGDQAGQDNAIAALQQVESQYSTDPSRIYMTGNSLGGIGTWDTMLKYNAYDGTQGQIFDAGMPLAGNDYAIPADQAAQELAAGNVPMWSYHGANDTQVPNGFDEQVAADLQNDPNYHYTEVANTGHDVWDSVYTDPSTWNWLFSQQGPAPASSTATATS